MTIAAMDDEPLALELLVSSIKDVDKDATVLAFEDAGKFFSTPQALTADVLFLDIKMRDISGIEVAKRVREISPQTNIIFVTGYDEYAVAATNLHASGYVLKPVTAEKIRARLDDLLFPVVPKPDALVKVSCFGNFDAFLPDGERINFERSKAKEIFAYLVYRRGKSCSVKEISGILFEDEPAGKKQAAYTYKLLNHLAKVLKNYGLSSLLTKSYNSYSVKPEIIDCDYYRFLDGDMSAVNAYGGEFMAQFSWAEFVTGYLERKIKK